MQLQDTHQRHGMNYYHILGISQLNNSDLSALSDDDLKAAYHRALLLHHPDKSLKHVAGSSSSGSLPPINHQYSIDEIVLAYQTLADPKLKRDYDERVLRNNKQSGVSALELSQKGTHLGVETYDLDDLEYQEAREVWTRSCRCGDQQGYTVEEGELERASKDGEIYVGCHGCSLFIKVLFSALGEEIDTVQAQDNLINQSGAPS